jgi:hypothetical protein
MWIHYLPLGRVKNGRRKWTAMGRSHHEAIINYRLLHSVGLLMRGTIILGPPSSRPLQGRRLGVRRLSQCTNSARLPSATRGIGYRYGITWSLCNECDVNLVAISLALGQYPNKSLQEPTRDHGCLHPKPKKLNRVKDSKIKALRLLQYH